MAPIKFEEHIKEKLDKRTLQPSCEAWDKLSKRLDTQDEKGTNKTYWWLGLAASVVGVLFVASQFLNTDTRINDVPKVVVTPEVIQQESNNEVAVEEVEVKDFNSIEDSNKEKGNQVDKKKTIIQSKTEQIIETNSTKEVVAVIVEKQINKQEEGLSIVKSIKALKEELSFEDQKIQAIVAQVQDLKENNKDVTDADINALLEQAQKEIRLYRLYDDETTGVVDANLLLQDVEADLDRSFRTKVFEAIKASYGSVKTAVAQRND